MHSQIDKTEMRGFITDIILTLYITVFSFVLPLCTEGKGYSGTGMYKMKVFKVLTGQFEIAGLVFPWLLLILLLVAFYFKRRKWEALDFVIIGYGVFVLISSYFSTDHELALQGYPGWNMGMLSQMSFIMLYFLARAVSDYHCRKIILAGFLVTSGIAAMFGVCNNFGIYPLMNLSEAEKEAYSMYMSTLGNVNWYCSYLAVMIPAGMFVYRKTDHIPIRILCAVYIILCMMSVIFARTDAIIAAILILLLVFFCMSLDSSAHLSRALEITAITFLTFRVSGELQFYAHGYNIVSSSIGTVVSRGTLPIAIAAACLGADFLLIRKPDLKEKMNGKKGIAAAAAVLLFAGCAAGLILSQGDENPVARKIRSYLKFDDSWGNNRGMLWRITVEGLELTGKDNPRRLLTGFGPDGYFVMIYRYFEDIIRETYEGAFLTNAHNEWLTAIVNYGIVGGLLYLGIFLTAFISLIRRKKPWYLFGACAVAAYFTHNFFTFQNILCTPFIFLVIGLSSADEIMRPAKENGEAVRTAG